MQFAIDWIATGILLGIVLVSLFAKYFFFPQHISPSFFYSRLSDLKYLTWRSKWASFPHFLHKIALASLMIAFIDPHLLIPKSGLSQAQKISKNDFTEGIAMYLVLDQSGSMAELVNVHSNLEKNQSLSKIDVLKQLTRQFILDHPSDLIGLVSFARVPRVLVPLTLDRETLLKQLNQIQVAKNTDEDGTAIGYAIYKTANLLAATRQFADESKEKDIVLPYTIKSAVIIVVTDGFQDPSHLDEGNRLRTLELDDAAAFAKSQNIRLYVINIDPVLSRAQYAPERRQLKNITTMTGGQFYSVNTSEELQEIYSSISTLEKGTISQEIQVRHRDSKSNYDRFSFYPFFLFLGMGALLISLALNVTLFRIVP